MIDIIKAKKAFKDYVKNYNPENEKIKLKIAHIERTARNSKRYSKKLKPIRRRCKTSRINRTITRYRKI